MGDCLRTGKPSRYITNHQGQLSLPSLPARWIEYRPAWLGLMRGVFTGVGWQVTLCDPIWQVMLHSSVMGFHLYSTCNLFSTDAGLIFYCDLVSKCLWPSSLIVVAVICCKFHHFTVLCVSLGFICVQWDVVEVYWRCIVCVSLGCMYVLWGVVEVYRGCIVCVSLGCMYVQWSVVEVYWGCIVCVTGVYVCPVRCSWGVLGVYCVCVTGVYVCPVRCSWGVLGVYCGGVCRVSGVWCVRVRRRQRQIVALSSVKLFCRLHTLSCAFFNNLIKYALSPLSVSQPLSIRHVPELFAQTRPAYFIAGPTHFDWICSVDLLLHTSSLVTLVHRA